MRSSLLTSIARTIASTLVPSRINVEKDSLAKAISRKIGNDSISFKTETKLLAISNYNALPKTAFDRDPESCTHGTSVKEMKKQLLDASRATGGSRKKSRAVGDRINRIVNSIEKRVRFAEDLWTQSYWKSRDGDTAGLQKQASTAVQRLGYKPEWKDYCLTQQVSQMAQELTIPAHAICRMQDAFHGIYRIPQKDPSSSTPLTFTDFPNPGNLPDFVDLSVAAKDLQDAHALLPSFHDDGVRDRIERALQDLDQNLQTACAVLKSRHDELLARPQGATEELNAICKWLGMTDAHNEAAINQAGAPQARMTITEAFKAAAETDECSQSELKQLEEWVVAKLALPTRPETKEAPYAPSDFPSVSPAAEGTNLVSAQAELSNVAKVLAADPDNPSSPQLRSLIEDLHSRAGKTVMYWLEGHARLDGDADTALSPADEAELERIAQFLGMTGTNDDLDALSEASSEDSYATSSSSDSEASAIHPHIQARLSGIDSGSVRGFPQKQHFMFNDMIDRAENLRNQVADIRNDQGNASPYRALARQWLGLPEGTEPEVQVNVVADPDASLEVRMDHAPLAGANLLNLFASAMDCFRDAGGDFVEREFRSADAMAAMAWAFVGNLGFNLPGGQQQHVLADFPDALEMQTFRSIRDQMSDLDLMRSQLRHLDSGDGKRRLSDRLGSFRAALERAEDFWTDRLLELEQRNAAGDSVKDEIHIARKWLGSHDHVAVPHVAPTSDLGGTHSHRRASSLASHLFVESETEQLPPKRKMLADNTDSRAHARMMAMR